MGDARGIAHLSWAATVTQLAIATRASDGGD